MRTKKGLMAAVWDHLCVPIDATCNSRKWVHHWHLKTFTSSNDHYKYACAQVAREINLWSYKDYVLFYEKHPTLQWMNHTYYTVEESLEHIEKLLIHQCHTEEGVKAFVNKMYAVCEKLIPKRNAIYISGSPSSCKTYFCMMVCSFYLSFGEVENPKRYSQFPYNNCPNKRILYWNEPEYTSTSVEDLKKLLAGDLFSVNVKRESNVTLSRTPVLITSNNHQLFNHSQWQDRIFYITPWSEFRYMKDKTNFPHPLTWMKLVDKYVDLAYIETLRSASLNKKY